MYQTRIGLVGFPGSGRTTVFNALTGLTAETGLSGRSGGTNLGVVKLPDPRLDGLAAIYEPKRVTPTEITFSDIVGGSAARELDRNVLNAMRDVDALCQVLRAFENPLLEDPAPRPRRELDDLLAETILADLELVERRLERLEKEGQSQERGLMERLRDHLESERRLRSMDLGEQEIRSLAGFQFLTLKPLLLVLNVGEDDAVTPAAVEGFDAVQRTTSERGLGLVTMSAQLEMEIAQLPEEEQEEFCSAMGIDEPARSRFLRAAFELLELVTMFTVGDEECRAWPIRRGTPVQQAAGKVHTDMERGFIRAEVVKADDLIELGNEAKCREAGKLQVEGRNYIVEDGDVVHVRFNV